MSDVPVATPAVDVDETPKTLLLARTNGCSEENGNGNHYDNTLLELTQRAAQRLLTLRGLFASFQEQLAGTYLECRGFYSIEAFDYSVDVGPKIIGSFEDQESFDPYHLEYDVWYRVPLDTKIHDHSKADTCCIVITDDGVRWTFYNKYTDAPKMSTPELSWAALQEVAAGRDPFEPYFEDPDG